MRVFLQAMVLTSLVSASALGQGAQSFVRGEEIPLDARRPEPGGGSVSAVRVPLRVHQGAGVSERELRETLADAERAFDLLVHRMGFAAPLPDGTRGGSPALDVYVVRALEGGDAVRVEPDALAYGEPWDRSPAVISLRAGLEPRARLRALTEGMAQASLWGSDARAPRAWRVGFAAAIAARALGEGASEEALERAAQDPGAGIFERPWSRPSVARPGAVTASPVAARSDERARGGAVFFDWLDARFDNGSFALWRGLATGAVGWTEGGASTLSDEPDVFDLLRRLLRSEQGGLDEFISDFAVVRGLTGSPGDRFDSVGWREGPSLAPRPLREVSYRQLPLWAQPETPLASTGAAYVSVDTRGLREGTMSVWFHGAPWRRWRVVAVRLDAFDRERGRAPSPPVNDGEWATAMELDSHDARVMFVIVNLGDERYDPEHVLPRDGLFALNVVLRNARNE
ncbi:MAG: hypothetical protein Q8Q09_10230 [Deltaproteobacteria bacterium]|nr:hypothetical protein [Deltaproteobacteria bacterium]